MAPLAAAEVRGAAVERGESMTAARIPQPVFGPVDHEPLDARPVLTGTFGETRGGHFHAGLDYSTSTVPSPSCPWSLRPQHFTV